MYIRSVSFHLVYVTTITATELPVTLALFVKVKTCNGPGMYINKALRLYPPIIPGHPNNFTPYTFLSQHASATNPLSLSLDIPVPHSLDALSS